ncbi:hypothetical protein HPB50_014091 [Hyalomma asiaticum]|uniref:Uncharacterized protein n=1 Tax=Hyalomma asiaticum TaxID=266040 RepID=A0ACB7S5P0_HYAAI|nr:hypothetical protein HPB50_014091 [Hyalomma asiaticum]
MADRGKDDQVSRCCPLVRRRASRALPLPHGGRPPRTTWRVPRVFAACVVVCRRLRESSLAPRWAKHCGAARRRRRRKWRSVPLLRIDFAGTPHRRACCGGKPTPPGTGDRARGGASPRVPDLCFCTGTYPVLKLPESACPAHFASAANAEPRMSAQALTVARRK